MGRVKLNNRNEIFSANQTRNKHVFASEISENVSIANKNLTTNKSYSIGRFSFLGKKEVKILQIFKFIDWSFVMMFFFFISLFWKNLHLANFVISSLL